MNEVKLATRGARIPIPQRIGGRPPSPKGTPQVCGDTHGGRKAVLIAIIRVAVLMK